MPKLMRPKIVTQEEVTEFCEVLGIDMPQYTTGWLGHDESLVPEVMALVKALARAPHFLKAHMPMNAEFQNPMVAETKLRANIQRPNGITIDSSVDNEYRTIARIMFTDGVGEHKAFNDHIDLTVEERRAAFRAVINQEDDAGLYLLAQNFAAVTQHRAEWPTAMEIRDPSRVMRVKRIVHVERTSPNYLNLSCDVPIDYQFMTFHDSGKEVTTGVDAFQDGEFLGRTIVVGEPTIASRYRTHAGPKPASRWKRSSEQEIRDSFNDFEKQHRTPGACRGYNRLL